MSDMWWISMFTWRDGLNRRSQTQLLLWFWKKMCNLASRIYKFFLQIIKCFGYWYCKQLVQTTSVTQSTHYYKNLVLVSLIVGFSFDNGYWKFASPSSCGRLISFQRLQSTCFETPRLNPPIFVTIVCRFWFFSCGMLLMIIWLWLCS